MRGKAAYLSPEQARGLPVDARSDLFSAGVILHELLTGQRLFAAPSDLLALEHVLEAPVPSPRESRPEIPEALADAVLSALERDPERRPASAAALGAAPCAARAASAGSTDLARAGRRALPARGRASRPGPEAGASARSSCSGMWRPLRQVGGEDGHRLHVEPDALPLLGRAP